MPQINQEEDGGLLESTDYLVVDRFENGGYVTYKVNSGTMAAQDASSVTITGGDISGVSLSELTFNSPTINGGRHTGIDNLGLSVKDTAGDNTLTISTSENMASSATVYINVNGSSRTLTFDGDATISGNNSGDENITGTANRITVNAGVVDIAPTYAGQSSITTLGTVTSGNWNGGVIAGAYGGTGVANTGKTITLGGNLSTSGAHNLTITLTGNTSVTFPTSGTLSTTTGTVTSIATGTGLTGGTITTTGTISLASIANNRVLANISGSSSAPSATSLTALVDSAIGSTQGSILYRDASDWVALTPGTSGQFLKTLGAAANPQWSDISGVGTVTSVATGTGLTGGTITTTGTISLASIADNTLLANISGSSAAPSATSLSDLIDASISDSQGAILYRSASGWESLAAGTNGYYLKTQGAGANPTWAAVSGSGTVTSIATGTGLTGGPITSSGTISLASVSNGSILANISGSAAAPSANTLTGIIDSVIGNTQGSVLYRNGSAWVALSPGTSGQFLQTQGAAANPQWANASGSGTVNSGTAGQLTYYAGSGTAVSGNANATISSGALTLGVATSVQGSLVLAGSTSGTTTLAAPVAGTGTMTLQAGTDTLVGRATTDTLSNKTLDNSTAMNIKDGSFIIQNSASSTKQMRFSSTNVTAGQLRVISAPDSDTTLPIISQVLTFSGPTAARTYTLPDASATLVSTDGTQTLTNKTINASNNTVSNITESMLSLSDVTTNNATISQHGFLPKLSNVSTEFLNGTGAWSTPAGGTSNNLVYTVRVATTGNGTLATAYENGDTVDGVVLATGDLILLKNQTAGAENGIYTVAASGAPSRASFADTDAELRNCVVYVKEGTANKYTVWQNSNTSAITVGTTAQTYQFLSGGNSSGGTTGSNVSVALGPNVTSSATSVVAIGQSASASSASSIAIGLSSVASTGSSAIAIGNAASSTEQGNIAIGSLASAATNQNNIAIGTSSAASGDSAIALGNNSDASGPNSIAIGGSSTDASSADATGTRSVAIGNNSNAVSTDTISIGSTNTADGNTATAIGQGTTASGTNSIAIGTGVTVASGHDYSVAVGYNTRTRNNGQFVFGSISDWGTAGGSQKSLTILTAQTTNATPSGMFSNAGRLLIPSDSTFGFIGSVVARRTDADNESAFYTFKGCIDNNAGTTALVGPVTYDYTNEDTPAWAISVTADNTNDALSIEVTGEVGKTIRWVAFVETFEVVG